MLLVGYDPHVATALAWQGRALVFNVEAKACPAFCLSVWEQSLQSLLAHAWCHQPHGTQGGQGGAKGPLRGWVQFAPAATAKYGLQNVSTASVQ